MSRRTKALHVERKPASQPASSTAPAPAQPFHPVLQLQQLIGNQAVARLLAQGAPLGRPAIQREGGDGDEEKPKTWNEMTPEERRNRTQQYVQQSRERFQRQMQEQQEQESQKKAQKEFDKRLDVKILKGINTVYTGARRFKNEFSREKSEANSSSLKSAERSVESFRHALKSSRLQKRLTKKARNLYPKAQTFSTFSIKGSLLLGSPLVAGQFMLLQAQALHLCRKYEKYEKKFGLSLEGRDSLDEESQGTRVTNQPPQQDDESSEGPYFLDDLPELGEGGFELLDENQPQQVPETEDVPNTNQQGGEVTGEEPQPGIVIGGYRGVNQTPGGEQPVTNVVEEEKTQPRFVIGNRKRS